MRMFIRAGSLLASLVIGASLLAAAPATAAEPGAAASAPRSLATEAVVEIDGVAPDEGEVGDDAPEVEVQSEDAVEPMAAQSEAVMAAAGCQSFKRPSKKHVTVPAGYCYKPKAKKNKTLHDFCTKSPDGWAAANFKGPCARHDMCIEGKKVARSSCDATFRKNMLSECRKTYGKLNPLRYQCESIALAYYAVVRAKTAIS